MINLKVGLKIVYPEKSTRLGWPFGLSSPALSDKPENHMSVDGLCLTKYSTNPIAFADRAFVRVAVGGSSSRSQEPTLCIAKVMMIKGA